MDARFLVLNMKDPGEEAGVREYHKRKHHTKDHLGCSSCKQRRIKCDKTRPTCLRCIRAQRNCQYRATVRRQQLSDGSSTAIAGLVPASSCATTIVESILGPLVKAQGLPNASRNATPVNILLSHITSAQGSGVFGPMIPLDPSIWDLSCRHPHLLAALLAVSSCHLNYHTVDASAHRAAEYTFASTALALFRPALLQELNSQTGSDALLLTSMTLNMLAFAAVNEDSDQFASWVFSDDKNRLSWLGLQLGLKPLLLATKPFRNQSLLQPMFAASDDEYKTFSTDTASLGRLPEGWTELISSGLDCCRVDGEQCSGKRNATCGRALVEPVRALADTKRLRPSAENMFRYVQFVGKMEPEFLRLLYERDERTLWIFGYWLGLVGRLGMWWSDKRVQRDRAAIKTFLMEVKGVCERDGPQGVMWRQRMEEYCTVGYADVDEQNLHLEAYM
ncbi:Sterol uptake control protein 2 [Madurella fahalii]|uniref:Sterol uptake control protein 2 n=1 Tax=Madurella fahalii TaxID=1157608 RepID=A0ABQ0GGS0_9PEZI